MSSSRTDETKTSSPACVSVYVDKTKYVATKPKLFADKTWFNNKTNKYRFSDFQRLVSLTFDETLVWQALNKGFHVLLSARAGAGKSTLLRRIITTCCYAYDFTHVVSAYTAVAASQIGGQTLHKHLGLGLANVEAHSIFPELKKQKNGRYRRTWRFLTTVDLLIIDEVSMIQPSFFELLDQLFRLARNKRKTPFGGVQLLMVGDFSQLGPVDKTGANKMIIHCPVWSQLSLARIHLIRSYRQSDNSQFLTLLDHIRQGQLTLLDKQLIKSRLQAPTQVESMKFGLESITIFPLREQVRKHNLGKLDKLTEKQQCQVSHYYPLFSLQPTPKHKYMTEYDKKRCTRLISSRKSEFKCQLRNLFPIFDLRICKGAQVMMRCNVLFEDGVQNGTLGIVERIAQEGIYVRFLVDDKLSAPIRITRQPFTNAYTESCAIVMKQFPLSLAWASTVHKVQGMTLQSVHLNASNFFSPGQLYTAFSRVRQLEDISLISFDSDSLIVDKERIAFEIEPEEKGRQLLLSKAKKKKNG